MSLTPEPRQDRDFLKTTLAVLFLILAYWPVSFGLYSMKWDMMDWVFPMHLIIGELLQAHEYPLWNPYINLGYPFIIDPQSGALYPLVWFFGYFFGYSVSLMGIQFVVHVIIGFLGFKKLGKTLEWSVNTSIVIGLAYACSGFFVGNAQHLSYIGSSTWIPWIIAAYYGLWKKPNLRDALLLSFGLSMLLLGGYPAFFIVTGYSLLVYFLVKMGLKIKRQKIDFVKNIVKYHAIAVVAFFLQSCSFIWFFIESLPLINRSAGLPLEQIQLIPFSPQSLISFLTPLGLSNDGEYWQSDISMINAYIGLGAILFIIGGLLNRFDKKTGGLIAVALLFFGIALGDFFILRGFLYHYVPLMDMFRYPGLFRLFFIIPLLIIAGTQLDLFCREEIKKESKSLTKISIGVFIMVSLLAIYFGQQAGFVFPKSFSTTAFHTFVSKTPVASLIIFQAAFQLIILSLFIFLFYKKSTKGILILMLVDLFFAVQLNCFSTIVDGRTAAEVQSKIDEYPAGFLNNQRPLIEVTHAGNGSLAPIYFNNNMIQKEIAKNGYNNFRLRAYEVFTKHPQKNKFLKQQPIFTIPETRTNIDFFSPNQVEITSDGDTPSVLYYTQVQYPGWSVYVNEKQVGFYKNDAGLLAVELEKGSQKVRFQFMPGYFTLFFWVSLISLGIVFWVLMTNVFKKVQIL